MFHTGGNGLQLKSSTCENMYIQQQLKHSADPISDSLFYQSVLTVLHVVHVSVCLRGTAGQDMSTPASVDSSLCWREESIHTGSRGAAATPTTSRGWCPSAPSVLLWVSVQLLRLLFPLFDVSWVSRRFQKSSKEFNLNHQIYPLGFLCGKAYRS